MDGGRYFLLQRKGSPACFEGAFSAGDTAIVGDWVYPGGGHHATMTRTP